MNRLDGKVALISGAARGIGAETARRMAEAGAQVVIGDILEDRAEETVKEIKAAGGRAMFVKLDVTSEANWTAAVSAATKQFGDWRTAATKRLMKAIETVTTQRIFTPDLGGKATTAEVTKAVCSLI